MVRSMNQAAKYASGGEPVSQHGAARRAEVRPQRAAPGRLSLKGMLRLWDARTGSYAMLASTWVPLRVCVHGPAGGTWSRLADLRVLLVADVLTRIAELQGLETITVLAADSAPPAGLDEDLSALGIHPPAALASYGDAGAMLGGPAHVHVARHAAGSGGGGDGVLAGVGPVQDLTQQAAGGNRGDLLALRFALLSCPYREPATLTQAALADAAESASRWRHRVAGWASEPSRPVPAQAASMIGHAFDDDLDTVAALDLLRNLESRQDIPAGAKFETFLFVDRVLGLELPREIGL